MQYVCINFLGFFVEGYCNTFHTPRADCNASEASDRDCHNPLPPHAPCRLQPNGLRARRAKLALPPHAPCRLQRTAAVLAAIPSDFASTRSVQIATCCQLRANSCNAPLPPHAPCRLQQVLPEEPAASAFFASTRSVQIAAFWWKEPTQEERLCLHTLRADCSGRNAQNAYALFRTCVELVDSFSVLNKAMLR